VLVCQQGLSDRTMEWDKGLFDICEGAEAAGLDLVWDGDYPAFGALDENGAYDALFDELDENDDGVVNQKDSSAAVHLIGFSWGGINVANIADRLRLDDRILTSRRGVAALVLLDAFQPQISRVTIPSNVSRAWVYRQTDTTSGDCSTYASLGFGFNGHRPKAKSDKTACRQYDLDSFAEDVGHCDVPLVARDAALLNLTERRDYAPWADHATACPLK
jgi:pimeloyl-ACP methyl ester carboxylesterase